MKQEDYALAERLSLKFISSLFGQPYSLPLEGVHLLNILAVEKSPKIDVEKLFVSFSKSKTFVMIQVFPI